MDRNEIVAAFGELLTRRGIEFREDAKLTDDKELDSYDLVSIMLEMEEWMDVTFDDDTQVMFGEATFAKICDQLSTLT